jgi:hypothetical protein
VGNSTNYGGESCGACRVKRKRKRKRENNLSVPLKCVPMIGNRQFKNPSSAMPPRTESQPKMAIQHSGNPRQAPASSSKVHCAISTWPGKPAERVKSTLRAAETGGASINRSSAVLKEGGHCLLNKGLDTTFARLRGKFHIVDAAAS